MQRIVPCKAPCGVVCLQRAPTPTQHALLAGPCPPQPVFHSACIRSLTTSRGKAVHASADASSSGRQDAAASSSGNSVQEGLGKAATFWKDPTKSQQMEKKWADLRRKRNQSWGFYQRRFVYASLQASPLGKALGALLARVWELLMPLRNVCTAIHIVAYNLSARYNTYCMAEAKVEWRLGNYYFEERGWWTMVMLFIRDMILTLAYLSVTPATPIFAVLVPTGWALLMQDDFWTSASFVTMLLCLPLKFPHVLKSLPFL